LLQRLGFEMRIAAAIILAKPGSRDKINCNRGGGCEPYQVRKSANFAGKWTVMNTKYEIVVYWSEQDGCFLPRF